MALRLRFGDQRWFRHRLKEINLEPGRSTYEIVIELQVNGIVIHRLPPTKKGQLLHWSDLCLSCDVSKNSTITLRITEVHPIRARDRIGSAMYQVCQVMDQDEISIECGNGMFTVRIKFLDDEAAKHAFVEALEKVRRLEKQPGMLNKAGRIGDAFKVLLALGNTMADLDPTGSAKVVFSVCTKAWEHLEQQEKQNTELNELVESLARTVPSVESIKDLADDNLKETILDMLNLIEDVSLFILGFTPRGSFERAWRAAINSDVQEKTQAYIAKFESLRKEFDTRINVQSLRALEIERINTKLRELKPADLAGYDPDRQCIPGTRVSVIHQLVTWAQKSDDDSRFAWVVGLEKSSIATSVCQRLDDQRALACSFFCKRDNPELCDPRRVLTTVIYGLALRWEPYRDAVVAVIRQDLGLSLKHIQPLYDSLVVKPLQKLVKAKQPTVTLGVVIDALDECGEAVARKQLLACLRDMSEIMPQLKIITTSRSDADIQEFFGSTEANCFTRCDLLECDASDDIRVFMRRRPSGLDATDQQSADFRFEAPRSSRPQGSVLFTPPLPTGSAPNLSSTQIPAPHAVGNAFGNYAAAALTARRGVPPATVQATGGAVGTMPRAQPSPYQEPISRDASLSVQSPGSPTPFLSTAGPETIIPGLLAPDWFLKTRPPQSGHQSSLYPRSSSPSFRCSSSTEDFASDPAFGTVHPGTISRTSLESGPSNRYGDQSKLSPLDTSGGIPSTDTSRPVSTSSSPGQRSNKSFKETAWGTLVIGLKTLDKCTGGCPTVNQVIKGLVSCVDAVQESERHRKEYDELARNLSEMTYRLTEHHKRVNSAKMTDCTMSLMSSLQAEIDHVVGKQKRSAASRVAGAMGDREDLVDCYRRIEMIFSRLTIDATLSSWSITHEHLANTRLDGLAPATRAWYDCSGIRRHACTPNTRQQILTELKKWANDTNSPKVLWLNGMAGTGKTTIAYSLCSELESSCQLGASFFCYRTLPECRDMGRIIPTIAYQLARSSLPFQHALCETLGVSPDMHGISLQFEKLLRDPLLKVENALPPVLVVVIDALDECAGLDGAHPVLDALIHHARDLPIKFFVTSRPEPGIHNRLGSQDSYTCEVMHLHNIEESLVQTDIETYLDEELGDIPESSEKVKMLASRAKNLFIYAASAVRYIKPHGLSVDPHKRLDTMLEVDSDPRSKKHEEIDALYSAILTAALANPRLEPTEAETIRTILNTVICVREPMNAEALARLLGLPNKRKVELSLDPLRSVLHIPDSIGPVSTLHESFPDYMLNRDRSRDFFCDRAVHSELMVRRCFETMNDSLRFNICGLESSFTFDEDIHDLEKRIDDAISPELFYACRYWGDHLRHANPSSEILALLDTFLSQQLLFWMEVLNLKGCVGARGRILLQAHMWLETCQASDQVRNLVLDARKFVVTFGANSVSRSTPHIYISALLFWSTTDPVWQIYGKRTRGLIKPQGTAMERRDRSNVAVWALASRVISIAVSSDGSRIISGSDDFLVRIWDSRNGNLAMEPLVGHKGGVVSVAFSPDDAWVASGSNDHTVRIWDAQTGHTLTGPLEGGNSCVTSVIFSPHGDRVVSGSLDNMVRVWDARSGTLVAGPFKPHTDSIKSLAFSPQGIRVASGSDDCTVRVWDFRDGSVVAGPFQAHGESINSVAFSPDGSLVASGANDHSICIWDVKHNGAVPKMAFKGHADQVTSVAFSPNGAHVVSGSYDRTVRVWSLRTRDIMSGPFKGHTDTVTSVAFTPDGTGVVSGSHDKTIRIWDLRSTSTPAASLEGHTGHVCSVAFSPNGNCFMSSSRDSTIRIWDARSGATVAGPFGKANSAWASSVSFSPKGSRIALGFSDGTVCIRDSQSGKHLVEPFTGHAGWITSVGFSSDGYRIVSSSSDGNMFIWSARSGRILFGPLQHASGSPIRSAMFSPDGKRVASSSDDGTICVWDADKGRKVDRQFNGHGKSVRSVAFSPGGNYIVSGSDDCTIRIWDAQTGMTAVGPLQGHTDSVNTVAFSSDGALVASGSHDHTIRVWNAKSGALTAVLNGHTGSVNSIAFSPNGAHIVSGSSDLAIRLWDVSRPLSNAADISKDWTLGDDGWVIGRDKQLLLWVPNDLRTGLMQPQNPMIVYRRGSLRLNLEDALMGERWQECYVR